MVHFVGDLLATGITGSNRVSIRLADSVAISDCGDCGGRGLRITEGDFVFARANFAWAENGVATSPSIGPTLNLKSTGPSERVRQDFPYRSELFP
jgi:hypothetical protein